MDIVTNLDEYKSTGSHWAVLYVNGDNGSASYNTTCLDSFGVEYIPKEILKFAEHKNIITNITTQTKEYRE